MEPLREFLAARVLPSPVKAKQKRYSMLYSTWDEAAQAQPTDRLLDVAAKAVERARRVDLKDLSQRLPHPPYYPDVWPGEHYKLLAGIVQVLDAKVIVEIGTGGGLSALALLKFMRRDAKLVTFDLTPWTRMPGTSLRADDFRDGRLAQSHDDVTRPEGLAKHRALLETADLMFIDAAKDGVMERRLLDSFERLHLNHPLLVFDDIRLWNMLAIWRDVQRPKLDLTSFGHWSGTGLVDWV